MISVGGFRWREREVPEGGYCDTSSPPKRSIRKPRYHTEEDAPKEERGGIPNERGAFRCWVVM